MLFIALCGILPSLSAAAITSFRREVMKPAADLEDMIHLSSARYRFSDLKRSLAGDVAPKDMRGSLWIDVKTRRMVDSEGKMMGKNSQGFVGESLLQVEPSLVRIGSGMKEIMLRPAVYVIELYTPEAKRARVSK